MNSAFPRRMSSWSVYHGPHSISGTLRAVSTPVSRRVALLDQWSLQIARVGHSTASGQYTFERLREGDWIVVGIDEDGQYNAVIADRVRLQPGT